MDGTISLLSINDYELQKNVHFSTLAVQPIIPSFL